MYQADFSLVGNFTPYGQDGGEKLEDGDNDEDWGVGVVGCYVLANQGNGIKLASGSGHFISESLVGAYSLEKRQLNPSTEYSNTYNGILIEAATEVVIEYNIIQNNYVLPFVLIYRSSLNAVSPDALFALCFFCSLMVSTFNPTIKEKLGEATELKETILDQMVGMEFGPTE